MQKTKWMYSYKYSRIRIHFPNFASVFEYECEYLLFFASVFEYEYEYLKNCIRMHSNTNTEYEYPMSGATTVTLYRVN